MRPRISPGAGSWSRAALLVATTAIGLSAGCGVRLDDEPRELASDSVPFGLLAPATTSPLPTPSTVAPVPDFRATSVFLVDNDNLLVEVRRQLPGEVRVELAIRSLLTPPTEAEQSSGLRTAIPSTTVIRGVTAPDDGIVTIDLSADVDDGSPDIVRLGLAQLVYTASAIPGVEGVLFQVDGEAREVPTGEGQSTAQPLTQADYLQFRRPPTTTTTSSEVPPLDPSGG